MAENSLPSRDLYQQIEDELAGASSDELASKKIKVKYLSSFLNSVNYANKDEAESDIKPVSLSSLLSASEVSDDEKRELQDLGNYVFLLVPKNVIAVIYPNGDRISRELDISEKKEWTLKEIDEYRMELSRETGKPLPPIIFD